MDFRPILMRRLLFALVALAGLGGCAGHAAAPTLFAAQQTAVDRTQERPRLFYIGLALYAEGWSENDVVELANALQRNSRFEVVPLIASNLDPTRRKYPLAVDTVIARLVRTAADRARPLDMVMVHISTHGARGMLARQIADRPPTALTAAQLARQLAPLADQRTVIIISACYSGSLINALRSPRRIIITAARSDRSSFGCDADSRHTFFGEAELHGFAEGGRSLRQVFTAIRDDVARMERENNHTPSEPQISVGSDVADLYDAPLF